MTIDELTLKGHGGDDIIVISDTDETDSLAVVQDNILLHGHDIDELLDAVSDGNTDIWLTGCDTGPLAEDVSEILDDSTSVFGSDIKAIGIPWTGHSIGFYSEYENGGPAPIGPVPNFAEGEFSSP